MQEKPPADLVRTTLGVLFLGGLILSAFWILRPFIGATIWATMLVVSTWPVMKWLEARLWRKRNRRSPQRRRMMKCSPTQRSPRSRPSRQRRLR